MDPVTIAAALAGLVTLGIVLGALYRRAAGRIAARPARTDAAINPADLIPDAVLGFRATIVQFSTEYCKRCPAVRRMLTGLAEERPGVVHLDVDLTYRADLAERFRVRQTPTLLLLDAAGVPRSRIGGTPARTLVTAELDRLEETR